MLQHHRNIPFRPPRTEKEKKVGEFGLYLRFFHAYMLPHKWSIIACAAAVSVNAASGYLMAYYGRIVVDDVLVIRVGDQAKATPAAGQKRRIWAEDRERAPASRPREGMGHQIDRGVSVSVRPPGASRKLWTTFFLYVSTMVALNYLARFAQRKRIRIGQQITANLREDMHEKVLKLSLSYHRAHSPGRLMSRILSDVGVVQGEMMSTILDVISYVVVIIVGLAILLSLKWQMAAIAFSVIPIYVLIYKRAHEPLSNISKEIRHTNSCLYGFVSQKFEAIKAIQAYGREIMELLNFHRLTGCFLRDALQQQRLSARLGRSAGVVGTVGRVAIFLYGTQEVLNGTMTLGEMMYVYNAAMSLFLPILALSQMNVGITYLLVVLHRLVEVLDEPVEIVDAPDAVNFPAPLRKGIELRHVSFRYGPDADPVLDDVSFDVPAGNWLCLMGASGCGKTTLLYLLTRLLEPTAGEILIDGVPVKKIKMDSLRRSLALVPQEAQIFSGSIRDNICYGFPEAQPNEVMTAAKAAELHDSILEMKVQYETMISERGSSLSGGQRQRLSLARALITNPDVLVLDDCTSALDANTERKIQETLERILVGKTAVIVSQRVSMATRCHRICVIADGVVAEYGTHKELVAGGGFYSRLHAQQTH